MRACCWPRCPTPMTAVRIVSGQWSVVSGQFETKLCFDDTSEFCDPSQDDLKAHARVRTATDHRPLTTDLCLGTILQPSILAKRVWLLLFVGIGGFYVWG